MRRVLIAALVTTALAAVAGQGTLAGQGAAPSGPWADADVLPAQAERRADVRRSRRDRAARLAHHFISGGWAGAVEPVEGDAYAIRLDLHVDGSGRSVRDDGSCPIALVPVPGHPWQYREEVEADGGTCPTGTVRLRLRKGVLLWIQSDEAGNPRAAARLQRVD